MFAEWPGVRVRVHCIDPCIDLGYPELREAVDLAAETAKELFDTWSISDVLIEDTEQREGVRYRVTLRIESLGLVEAEAERTTLRVAYRGKVPKQYLDWLAANGFVVLDDGDASDPASG